MTAAAEAVVTPDHRPLTHPPTDVRAVLRTITVHKGAGPDSILGMFSECALEN